jgi:hypothetical protein
MHRQKVSSSNIVSIGYDPNVLILEIEFKGGDVYQYFQIPQQIFERLMGAKSHGRFLHAYIKKGGYAFKKIG